MTNEQKIADAVGYLLRIEGERDHYSVRKDNLKRMNDDMNDIANTPAPEPAAPPAPEGCRWELRSGYWGCYQGQRREGDWFLSYENEDFGYDFEQLDGRNTPENLRLVADASEMFQKWEGEK